LLAWYDRHRRDLPWRARPGESADPYRVWLSEIMLQQTTVKSAAPYFERFLLRFPNVKALAVAPLDNVLALWAGLGYYSRARHLHACARIVVEEHGGTFPRTEIGLSALPGIGPYTAAAIAAIAFDERAVPVDGNVERVVARLFRLATPLPKAKADIRRLAARLMPAKRSGDFAQALMDLGSGICRPKQPSCVLCPWSSACAARAAADQESYPRKTSKREGALRRGAAFVLIREDGAVLVRRREARGLLGGMTEVPGSEWSIDFTVDSAVAMAPRPGAGPLWTWRPVRGQVRHVFTHFPLELTVFAARARMDARAPEGCRFLPREEIADAAFPTLMRKVLAHAGVAASAGDAKRWPSISPREQGELVGDALPRVEQRPVRRPRRIRA
jgi:A/G-specific adenine glycosylase